MTTQQQKEELLTQKRRKRRRMLRERSPSPPTVQSKRQTPSPRLALSTRYSPDEMNSSPNFEEKKKFLTIFSLAHVSAEKRKGEARPACGGWGARGWLRPRRPPALGVPTGAAPLLSQTCPAALGSRLSPSESQIVPFEARVLLPHPG